MSDKKKEEEEEEDNDSWTKSFMNTLGFNAQARKVEADKKQEEAYLKMENKKKDEKKKDRDINFDVKMPTLDSFNSDEIFLQDNDYLKYYLSGYYEKFMDNKNKGNFQKRYHHQEHKILYTFENSLMTGDYIMLWPNPDLLRRSIYRDENQIDYNTAIKIFQEIFCDMKLNFNGIRKFQTKLKKAFEHTFFRLSCWHDKSVAASDDTLDELIGYSFKQAKFLNNYPKIYQGLLEDEVYQEEKAAKLWKKQICNTSKLMKKETPKKFSSFVKKETICESDEKKSESDENKSESDEKKSKPVKKKSKSVDKACCIMFGNKKKTVTRGGSKKNTLVYTQVNPKELDKSTLDNAKKIADNVKAVVVEGEAKDGEVVVDKNAEPKKILANGQFYIPENLVRYPYAANSIPYFYEKLDAVDYQDDMEFHQVHTKNGEKLVEKDLRRDKYISQNKKDDEDFLRERRVRYQLEVIQKDNMDYDIELWYVYKKLDLVDIKPESIKSRVDQCNVLKNCCHNFDQPKKNLGWHYNALGIPIDNKAEEVIEDNCGCGQDYRANVTNNKGHFIKKFWTSMKRDYWKRKLQNINWYDEEELKISMEDKKQYTKLTCNCETEEKILDIFTDKYKIRKVCFHGEADKDNYPKYQNWFTKEMAEKDKSKKKYSLMFDKRTVFLILSPDDKCKYNSTLGQPLKYGNNPCLTREVQILYKAPNWIKDGSKVVLEVSAENKGSIANDNENYHACCKACDCCNCCCGLNPLAKKLNVKSGHRVFHDLQVKYYLYEPHDQLNLKKDDHDAENQHHTKANKNMCEEEILLEKISSIKKIKHSRYIKETLPVDVEKHIFRNLVINPTNLENQHLKYKKRLAFEETKLKTIFKYINKFEHDEQDKEKLQTKDELKDKVQTTLQNLNIDKDKITFNFKKIAYYNENARTHDFMTLIRKVFNVVNSMSGLVVRQFITLNHYHIVSVIYCPTENLKAIAQTMGLNKQLEVGKTDILSLEPVDKIGRPYRLNNLLYDKEKWDKIYIKRGDLDENRRWERAAVPILRLLGTYGKKLEATNDDQDIAEGGEDSDDDDIPFFDFEKEFKECYECNQILKKLDDESEKTYKKFLRQHKRICSPKIQKNKKDYYWGISIYFRHTKNHESLDDNGNNKTFMDALMVDKTHVSYIKDADKNNKTLFEKLHEDENDDDCKVKSLGTRFTKGETKNLKESITLHKSAKPKKAEDKLRKDDKKKFQNYLRNEKIAVRVTAIGKDKTKESMIRQMSYNVGDSSPEKNNGQRIINDNFKKENSENIKIIKFFDHGFEEKDDFMTFYDIDLVPEKTNDEGVIVNDKNFLHEDGFKIDILKDYNNFEDNKTMNWEESDSKITEQFKRFTGEPDKDADIAVKMYSTDINPSNKNQLNTAINTDNSKNPFFWCLCVQVRKIEYKKITYFARSTGNPLDNRQDYEEYKDLQNFPDYWEWQAYEQYLRNLIPKMIQIDERYIQQKFKIRSDCEEFKSYSTANDEALVIGKYDKEIDGSVEDDIYGNLPTFIEKQSVIESRSEFLDSQSNISEDGSNLDTSKTSISKKIKKKTKQEKIYDAKEDLAADFSTIVNKDDLLTLFKRPKSFKMGQSNNKRIRTKNTKERQKVDFTKLKFHTANLYKKAFQLSLIDTNYEIHQLDSLGLKKGAVMTTQERFFNFVSLGWYAKKYFLLPKVESIWQKLQETRPMTFSMKYFQPSRKRKPLVKDHYNNIWKTYELNEFSDRALFSQMERQKCISFLMNSLINIQRIQQFYIQDNSSREMFFDEGKFPDLWKQSGDLLFPLHDDFKVNMRSMNKVFEDIIYIKQSRNFDLKRQVRKGKVFKSTELKDSANGELDKSQNDRIIDSTKIMDLAQSNPDLQKSDLNFSVIQPTKTESTIQKRVSFVESILMGKKADKESITDSKKSEQSYIFMKKYINKYTDRKTIRKKEEIYNSCAPEKKLEIAWKSKVIHKFEEEKLSKYQKKNKKTFNLKELVVKDYPLSNKFSIMNLINKKFQYSVIRDYYGEQITIYFKFLTFFCLNTVWVTIIGILIASVETLNLQLRETVIIHGKEEVKPNEFLDNLYDSLLIIYCFFTVVWLSRFNNTWQNEELRFAIQYSTGVDSIAKYMVNECRSYRTNSAFERSLVDDNLNDRPYCAYITWLYVTLALFVLFFFCVFQGVITLFLLYFKHASYNTKNTGRMEGIYEVFNMLEVFKIIYLNRMIGKLAYRITEMQQYKIVEHFQVSYINFVMFSRIVTILTPVVIIIFVQEDVIGRKCIGECREEAANVVGMYFYAKLLIHIYCGVKDYWLHKQYTKKNIAMRKKTLKVSNLKDISSTDVKRIDSIVDRIQTDEKRKANKKVGITIESSQVILDDQDKFLIEKYETILDECTNNKHLNGLSNRMEEKVYNLVNREIERQIQMECSEADDFGVNIIDEYLQILELIFVTILSAPIFSLGYLITWIIVAIEFENDKRKYLAVKRKIDPKSDVSLNHLNKIFHFMSWVSVLTNSYLMTKHLNEGVETIQMKMFLYFGSFFAMIFVKYVIVDTIVYGDVYDRYSDLSDRRNFIITKILNRFPDKKIGISKKKEDKFFQDLSNKVYALPGGDKPKPKKMRN